MRLKLQLSQGSGTHGEGNAHGKKLQSINAGKPPHKGISEKTGIHTRNLRPYLLADEFTVLKKTPSLFGTWAGFVCG